MHPVTNFLSIRGLELAVHRWGSADRPVLLFIHGFLDHGKAFAPMAELLCDRWQIVAPDMRGHGESGWVGQGGNYHFADYYDDLRLIVEQLRGPVGLIGHSMGGMIATGVAALFPEKIRALMLLDGMGPPNGSASEGLPRLQQFVETLAKQDLQLSPAQRRHARKALPSLAAAAARLQAANPRLSPAIAARLAETGTEAVVGGFCWRHDPLHRVPSARPFRVDEAVDLWRGLTMPVLSIYAEHSNWCPPDLDERYALIEQLVCRQLPGAGHNLHHEFPQQLAAVAAQWFEAPGPCPSALDDAGATR